MAALGRQNLRDLFDGRDLFANEGKGDDLRRAFIVYLVSYDRLISEVLNARCQCRRLTGKVAKLLFDGMRANAEQEECTAGMEKSGGNGLYCNKSADGTHLCEFGYSFSEDAFTASGEDC